MQQECEEVLLYIKYTRQNKKNTAKWASFSPIVQEFKKSKAYNPEVIST